MGKRDIVTGAKVTKVTWTKGQGGSRLILGGKAVLGEGCRASCDSSRDACFLDEKRAAAKWAALNCSIPILANAGRGPGPGRDRGLCRDLCVPRACLCPRGGDLCPHCGLERCGDHRGHDHFSGGRQRHGRF